MRILIDIGHPGHVHLFKQFAHQMTKNGHTIFFTARDKEFEINLLENEKLEFANIGKHYKTKIGKIAGLFLFTIRILLISLRFKPDIYLSHGSIYTALVASILRKPNIALEDSGNWEQVRLYLPFTHTILTSTSFKTLYGPKQIFYPGYHELAYLHPNQFSPDKSVLNELGIKEGEKYFILRFVSWNATHDIGQGGLTYDQKIQLVNLLEKKGKVFISSEGKSAPELQKYDFPLAPHRMHHALAFASMFIGEGATMASESAVLGTLAIYINTIQRDYLTDLEKYNLVYNYSNGSKLLSLVEELSVQNLKDIAAQKHKQMLEDRIDVTAFIIWFVENFPKSKSLIKNQPEFWNQFK